MANERDAWLALTPEAAIEPSLPICDPHHHLWDYPEGLPDTRVPPYTRREKHYLLNELLQDTGGGHNIRQTVFIECSSMYKKDGPPELRPVGEIEFVQGVAAQSASGNYGETQVAAGIVGFADLTLGQAVSSVLEAQVRASPNRFRGIRYISTWDASSQIASRVKSSTLFADEQFRQGFACLGKNKLSFDAWLYHTQLKGLAGLARAFPETTIIVDHLGGPLAIGPYAQKPKEVFRDWQEGVADLAACPNVVMKLGGLGMPMMGFGWAEMPNPPGSAELVKAMTPYFDWCLQKFGANRCMFESNFPVDKHGFSYTVIWNAFKLYSKDFPPADRAALFQDTAMRVYRLGI